MAAHLTSAPKILWGKSPNSRRAYLNILVRVTNHDIVRRTIRNAFMQIALILSQSKKSLDGKLDAIARGETTEAKRTSSQ